MQTALGAAGRRRRSDRVVGWEFGDLSRELGVDAIKLTGTDKQDAGTLTIDFRWLPPTRANLRELTAPIPPGFREVSG